MFESIPIRPLGNPVGDGLGSIAEMLVRAKERRQQEEQFRSKLMLDRENTESDNRRADAEMALQYSSFNRTSQNQAEERRRKGVEDFKAIWEAAGKDPALAMQLARAHGYKIDAKDFRNPVAVPTRPDATPLGPAPAAAGPTPGAAPAAGGLPTGVDRPPVEGEIQEDPDQRDPLLDIHAGEEALPVADRPPGVDPTARPPGLDPNSIDVVSAANALAEAHKKHKKKIVIHIDDVPITAGPDAALAPAAGPPPIPGPAPAPAPAPAAAPPLAPPPQAGPPAPAPATQPPPMQLGLDQAAPSSSMQPVPMPSLAGRLQAASMPGRFRISGGPSELPDVEIDPAASRAAQDEEDKKALRLRTAAPEVRAAVQRELELEKQRTLLEKRAHDDEQKALYNQTAPEKSRIANERTDALRQHNNQVVVQGLDKDTNQTINTFQGVVKEVKQSAIAKNDVIAAKNLSKINEELDGDGAAQAVAIDTLGQIAQGGKATNVVIGLLKHPKGLIGNTKDSLIMGATGRHSPEVIAAYKDAAVRISHSILNMAGQDYTSMYRKIGPGSIYYNDSTKALVDSELEAFANELGLTDEEASALESKAQAQPRRSHGTAAFQPGLSPGLASAPKRRLQTGAPAPIAPLPGGKHIRLKKTGETGTLMPDGTFHPDGG